MANALSKYYSGLSNSITTPVTLSNPFGNEIVHTEGLWDTGATNSVITKSMARRLCLKVVTRATVRGVHGEREVNVYYVRITLNNNNIVVNAQVTECEELSADSSIGMLIGMNIITMGDFCITSYDGKTVMSFIYPSQKKIDFVEEINEYNRLEKIHIARTKSGNDICPCGSGKKWKNCHGKIQYR